MALFARTLLALLLLLLLVAFSPVAEGKKKKSKKEWNDAWKKIEAEEFEEWEEEKAERMAEHAKYQDPMKMVEQMGPEGAAAMMGGMGSGNSGGPAMCFVRMKKELARKDTEEVVVKWRDLLFTNGFDIKPYVVEDQLVLLTLNEQYKVNELKDFVLDPYFAEDKVESFEYNSKTWYPEGSEEDLKEKKKQAAQKRKREEAELAKKYSLSPGELAAFKEIVNRFKAGKISATEAKEKAKMERKAMSGDSAEKDIRSAGYYTKVFGKINAAAKEGAEPLGWVQEELKNLRKQEEESEVAVVDVERKISILASFFDEEETQKKKSKKKSKAAKKNKKHKKHKKKFVEDTDE